MPRTSRIRLVFLLMFSGAIFISQAASIQEARTQYHAGKLDPALAQTNSLLRANPESISALFLKAQIQSENQQVNQAIKTYKTLIALDSGHLQAYNNLAALYAQQGKLVLASETLERAIRTDPVYTTIHANLRAIYMDMSKKHYRQALKLKAEDYSTQIASIDLSDNTDQILSEEVQVVPQSIQAAINTTVVRNTVTSTGTSKSTSRKIESPEPANKVKKSLNVENKPAKKPEEKTLASASEPVPAKVAEKPESKPKAIAKPIPKPKAIGKPKPKPIPIPKSEPKSEANTIAKAKPEAAPKKDPVREVKKDLLSWANAWSNRNVKRYVSAYKKGYAPAGKTHKDWAAGRGWNFKNKKYIKVSLSGIRIKADGNRYRATFKQRYESNSYQDVVNKEIVFLLQNGQWKIAKEITK